MPTLDDLYTAYPVLSGLPPVLRETLAHNAQRIAAPCAAQRQRGDAVGVRAAQHAGTLS